MRSVLFNLAPIIILTSQDMYDREPVHAMVNTVYEIECRIPHSEKPLEWQQHLYTKEPSPRRPTDFMRRINLPIFLPLFNFVLLFREFIKEEILPLEQEFRDHQVPNNFMNKKNFEILCRFAKIRISLRKRTFSSSSSWFLETSLFN